MQTYLRVVSSLRSWYFMFIYRKYPTGSLGIYRIFRSILVFFTVLVMRSWCFMSLYRISYGRYLILRLVSSLLSRSYPIINILCHIDQIIFLSWFISYPISHIILLIISYQSYPIDDIHYISHIILLIISHQSYLSIIGRSQYSTILNTGRS